ncbi:HgcAB-associated protein HgcC [Methanomassiliicoccus luminyensis]|uniref:HgcAB-associated protein HgcC n=1 Tax=Methanomassiliicoccus luminyensis TaxID=1080712 RepID=UPI00036DCA47|nr:HgcAB-associated protein [Methanomassiliicoccus luminyensis]
MVKAAKNDDCCSAAEAGSLKVESIMSMDERGQMVLPKEIRDKAGLKAGDKLAVVTRERDGKVCCIYLFKTDMLMETVRDRLGPLLDEAGTDR